MVAAAEDQVAHDHVAGRRDGHTLGTARVAAEQRRGCGAHIGADAVVEGDLLQRLVADHHLAEEVDEEAVARPQTEVRVGGGEHRRRLRGGRDAVDDRHAGTARTTDALTGEAHRLARRQYLLRRAHAGVLAAQVQDGGHAHRVDDVEGRHLLDGVHVDLLVGGVDAAADMHPRAVVRGVWAAAVHGVALAALTERGALGALPAGQQDLVARELHHAVGLRAVGAGLGQQVHGRLEDAIGEIVVGVDDGLFVPLDAVARDDLAELGHVALHVIVGLGRQGPGLGALEDLYQVDHVVLLRVGVCMLRRVPACWSASRHRRPWPPSRRRRSGRPMTGWWRRRR